MSAVDKIERVLRANVLKKALTFIPPRGATDMEIAAAGKALPRPLSARHSALLRRWNGMNLDVVRVYGATETPKEIRALTDAQLSVLAATPGSIVFGDDPAGFVYAELANGQIALWDSDFGDIEIVAANLDEFFDRLVFGVDAEQFAGEEWKLRLEAAKLL
jgi:hypothetical protein